MTSRVYSLIFLSFLLAACEERVRPAASRTEPEQVAIKADVDASRVQIIDNSLVVDGESVPQLWGAELQYFRLRGGQAKNTDPAVVEKLWKDALQGMKDAGMNAIGFYIPWDFHEVSEGVFDFDGKYDGDGDGKPDQPARNVKRFLEMVTSEPFNFKYIMVRPGPYINAEWGFLGFGAIPEWFHDKFPDSHMVGPNGAASKLYDYHSPELLKYSKLWFKALHAQVLKSYIGPGRPIIALQVDNETNFQWQSLYNLDYSAKNQKFFQDFLRDKYGNLAKLNKAYQTALADWPAAPKADSAITGLRADWYEFADHSIYVYLKKIQKLWRELGVTHKDVLFTLAESYNAMTNGQIPHLRYRNDPATGMQTVNLYPKTNEHPKDPVTEEFLMPLDPKGDPISPLFNDPFKADHDLRLADSANDAYFGGKKTDWVAGPEIQTGWWNGTNVRDEARQQTWLKMFGHGNKWTNLYYFNEGDVGSSRVDLQACKLEYSIVSPK